MIHVYALVERPFELDGLIGGVDDRPLRLVYCPPLYAVVSEHDRAPGASRERALAHAAVVAAVAERTDVVPVQYGAQHADDGALRAAVGERAGGLQEAMRRVGGHVEVVVRFDRPPGRPRGAEGGDGDGGDAGADGDGGAKAPPGDTVDAEGSGRAYLERRLERERAERTARLAASEQLRARTAPVEQLATEATDRPGPRGPERCLLVHRDEVEPLLAAVRAVAAEDPDLVVGGPWPPYTFASEPRGG